MFDIAYASEGRAVLDLCSVPPNIRELLPAWHSKWVEDYNAKNK